MSRGDRTATRRDDRADDVRAAGVGQNDDLRQARPDAQGAGGQADAGRGRLAAPRRHRAAQSHRRADRRAGLRRGPGKSTPVQVCVRTGARRRTPRLQRPDPRHRRPAARRRAADEELDEIDNKLDAAHGLAGLRRDDRAGRGQLAPRRSTTRWNSTA